MIASAPWIDRDPDPNIVPYASLTAAEQDAAAAALQAEIRKLIAAAPSRATDVERAGLRAATNLAVSKASGEFFLIVESPRFTADFDPAKLGTDRMAFSNSRVAVQASNGVGNLRDNLQCMGVKRPLPVREALALLLSGDNPEAELVRRRAEADQRRKAAAAAMEREAAERKERERVEREFQINNRDRIAAWDRAPRLVRALADVADRHPEYRALVNEIAPLLDEKQPSPKRLDKMEMPREWFLCPEKAARP